MVWFKSLNKTKKILLVIVGLQFLVLFLMVYIGLRGGGSGGADNDSFNMAVFVPIWLAAMIPALRDKQKKSEKEKSIMLNLLVFLAGLVLVVMVVFLVYLIK